MKIIFIRHSKTAVDPAVPIVLWGLSDTGIDKVRELASTSTVREIDVFYSSLQTKAIETMVYMAKPNQIPMRTHKDLTEITSFTNKFYTGDIYTQQIDQYYNGEIERIADGETIKEALGRFTAALEEIVAAEASSTTIGIITHGYILSFFTGAYTDLRPFDLHRSIQQPDVAEFDWESKTFTRLWGE